MIAKIFFLFDVDDETINRVLNAICAEGMRVVPTDIPHEYEIKEEKDEQLQTGEWRNKVHKIR